jgi:Bacterial Ig domain
MSNYKIAWGVLIVLSMAALMGSGCARGTAPTPPPVGNQPPVIVSLVAQSQQIYPAGDTEITCVAQDADGDQLNFTWSATGGSFSGSGPTVDWKAPSAYGTYVITVAVDDGKGGTVQSSVPVTVGANQSPIISSFTANPSGTLYGGTTLLTCIANDPDSDVLTYSWSASAGSISGVGNRVTWIAPSKSGSFNITVLVSDGKGGQTQGNVMVTVSATTNTTTLTPVAQETGTVASNGDRDTSRTRAGDDDKDVGYYAFWSFDTFSLAGKNIQNASLKLTTKTVVGDPFSSPPNLGGLRFWKVTYGDKLPSPRYSGSNLINVPIQTKPPTSLDVTQEIENVAAAAVNRFQVEALFPDRITNGDHVAQFIEWSDAVLEVTYSEGPPTPSQQYR